MPRWIVQIVGTTIVCAVTGWLALLTAHSSTIGPAVWPPVGIGLVAVLVFGNRTGWGIWFSTFFLLVIDAQRYRSGSDLSPAAFVTFAAGMASVYSAQALLGAWCIRKVLGGSVALLRVRDIAVFLIVAGPGHTVLAPTIGSVILGCLHTHNWGDFLSDWLMWLSSDTLGGVFFAPLALTLIGQPRDVWSKRIWSVGIPVVAAVALTAVGFLVARNWEVKTAEDRFRQEIASAVREIRAEVREVEQALVRFQSLPQKELLDSRYDKSSVRGQMKHLREYVPWAVNATALVVIPHASRAKFETTDNPRTAPNAITETGPEGQLIPAAVRQQYVVVVSSSPRMDGLPQGYDLANHPLWKSLVEQAAQTGEIAASPVEYSASRPRIRIVTPCFRTLNGNISLPVHPGKPPIYGYIAVEMDPSVLIEGVQKTLGEQVTIHLSQPDAPLATAPGGSWLTEHFALAGQTVPLEATASAAFMNAHRPRYATAAGWVGALLTVMLTALVLMATGRTALVEGEVRYRMTDLQKEMQHRKSIEASLRASEARLTEAQRITQLGYWEWKPTQDEMYWSPVLAELLNVMGSDHMFKLDDLMVRVHPEDRQFLRNIIETMPKIQRTMQLEFRVVRVDGAVRWFSTTITTSKSIHGTVVRGTVLEMTERKRAESALRDGKARLRLALDSAQLGTWEWHGDTNRMIWDEREEELFGFLPGQFDQRFTTFLNCAHPEDRQEVRQKLTAAMQADQPFSGEFRIVLPDGDIRWLAGHGQVLNASAGQAAQMIGIHFDITTRKRAELGLRTSESNLAEAQRIAQIGSFEWSPGTNQRWWSDEMFRVLGYEPHSVTPSFEVFIDRVHPADRELIAKRMHATLTDGMPYNFEYRIVRPDGAVRSIRVDAVVTRDGSGNVLHFHGTNQDITERKQIEESLQASEARLAEAQHMACLGSWESDPATGEVWGSEEMYRLLGRPKNLPLNREVMYEYVHAEDRQRVRTCFEKALVEGGSIDIEHRFIRPDGQVRHFFVHAKIVQDRDRTCVVGTTQDITEQKQEAEQKQQFEEQLQQTQKLESLGILAGGVAHDFNNLLTGILGNASLAREIIPAESELHEFLRPIEKSAEHAAQLCYQMLTYAGKGNTVRGPVDLNIVIDESRDLLRLATSKKTVLHVELGTGLPRLEGDESQLRQVLLNLVQNASEAMGSGGGTITVRTGFSTALPRHGNHTTCSSEHLRGECVWLEVADSGCGMEEATRNRIFEPFFTTKFTGRGLGLSVVHGIIRSHNGTICVTSRPNVGTTFHVYLPCQRELTSRDTGVLRNTPRPITWGDATKLVALVVDDEQTIRNMAGVALRGLGFTVVEARDGQEALDLFHDCPDRFRFVLLDVMMPAKDGREVLGHLHALRPDLPVVLMSGYSEFELGDLPFGPNLIYLQKPFRAADLNTCVRRVLGPGVATGV